MAVPIIAAVIGAGAAITAGERQGQQAKKSRNQQADAQERARSASVREQKRAEEEQRRANRRTPDVASLLGAAQRDAQAGAGSTLLSGAQGIRRNNLLLGGGSRLGS